MGGAGKLGNSVAWGSFESNCRDFELQRFSFTRWRIAELGVKVCLDPKVEQPLYSRQWNKNFALKPRPSHLINSMSFLETNLNNSVMSWEAQKCIKNAQRRAALVATRYVPQNTSSTTSESPILLNTR